MEPTSSSIFLHRAPWRQIRPWLYPAALLLVYLIWAMYMTAQNEWRLFTDYWPMSLTMLFGSFIGSSTPQGGAAVAFPVFTKLLAIPSEEARTFGLMIQSVGMGMATVLIMARGVRILPRVVLWASLGGGAGLVLGASVIVIPNPYPRLLFTLSAVAFGVALVISRWLLVWQPQSHIPAWRRWHSGLFLLVGLIGGIFSAYTGSGINLFAFVVLTLAIGIDEKTGTATAVVIMAINAMIGFFLHGVVSQDIGVVWDYWLVCVPIVVIGAPLGAFVASRVHRDVIIWSILALIVAETVSTAVLIPFTGTKVIVTAVGLLICALCFWRMLHYRQGQRPFPSANTHTPSPTGKDSRK